MTPAPAETQPVSEGMRRGKRRGENNGIYLESLYASWLSCIHFIKELYSLVDLA